ncbi:hypothetical protein FJT64_003514 [Amphibalanus amphitrite]|uniref:Aminotransferase class I/classII large domain-containing protein n=1 Tax=Amphibalanus amphitrite TaxID=1232801 RepID=A0A6A4VWM9_AMPAM|nr:hypothetical protein FJT64_003514 [Amphibalanus amphitrite]
MAISVSNPMLKVYPEGTILTSGFSKWLSAGGWRMGYAHYPAALAPLLSAVRSAASNTYSCAPAPQQRALAAALQPKHAHQLDTYIGTCCRLLRAVADYCASVQALLPYQAQMGVVAAARLHGQLHAVGVKGYPSQGAFYFMPDFEVCRGALAARGITTGDQMVGAILQEADVADNA